MAQQQSQQVLAIASPAAADFARKDEEALAAATVGTSSGYRRCLRRFAAVMAAAPTRGAVGMGAPVRVKGETRVICTIVTIAGSQEGGKDIVDTRTTVMNCVPLLA